MGRIRKEIFVSIVLSLLVMKSFAQELDTIYIIDLTVGNGKTKQFTNKGTVIYLNGDSVKLVANKNSTKIQLKFKYCIKSKSTLPV